MKSLKYTAGVVALALFCGVGAAVADEKADIKVMTQNQYLGADLTPIIEAGSDVEFNLAMVKALTDVANNNYPERVQALADSILDRQPHLVALQEMYAYRCVDLFNTGLCETPGLSTAFNDHLELTLAALGDEYEVAALVQNLSLEPPVLPIPGIPVVLDALLPPVFIQVIDRDVILARHDVTTAAVDFGCNRPSVDGCNYNAVAPVEVGGLPINIERGFVAVDATIGGVPYRFVNTHLEIKQLGDEPDGAIPQPAQATELWLSLLGNFDPTKRYIVAGDFNSAPVDVSPLGVPTAYQQLSGGVLINGTPLPFGLTDTWNLRPGNPDGFTCCELGDLSNAPSQLHERVDIVFAFPTPSTVKSNVLDAEVDDKTLSGLWPSDHASVIAELTY